MDQLRFLSPATENPRNLGFNNKPMPNDFLVQKPMTPIIDRFKAMLNDREDEIRALAQDDDDVPPPSTDEIVRLYDLILSELTLNSKPIITDLTIIAGEQREHSAGIAGAICDRIIEAAAEHKLPCLYLLDSIVKNIGKEYVRYFSARLPEVFCEAYMQVNPSLRPSMCHLFGTWSTVFPPSVLHKIEAQLKFSPAVDRQSSGSTPLQASESPRPMHGIHVNPKYLEARRQFEHTTAESNIQHSRGTSSLSVNGKHAVGYEGYDSDDAEAMPAHVAMKQLSSTDHAAHTSFVLDAEKLHPSSAARTVKSASPFGVGHVRLPPSDNEFNSSSRVVESASPSLDYGLAVVMGRDKQAIDWQRGQLSNDSHQRYDNPDARGYSNGAELRGPRALIDAYGTDQREKTMNHKPLKAGYLDTNSIDNKVAVRRWQNTEEEEFDWEDMSPTLATGNSNFDLFPSSNLTSGSFTARPGFETHRSVPVENDFRRGSWSGRGQLSAINGPPIVDDAVRSIGSGRGLINKISGLRNEASHFPGSHNPPEAWNFSQNLPQSSRYNVSTEGGVRNFQVPFLASAGEQKHPLFNGYLGIDEQRGSSNFASRISSSSVEPLNPEVPSASVPASTGAWPPVNMQKSDPLPPLAPLPLHKQIRRQFDSINSSNAIVDQGLDKSFLGQQQLDSAECKALSYQLPQFPHQKAGSVSLYQQSQAQRTMLQPPLIMRPEAQQNLVPPAAVSTHSHVVLPPLNRGNILQGHRPFVSTGFINPIPGMQPSMPILNIPNTSIHLPVGSLPPLPPGPRPASSQMIPTSHSPSQIAPNPPAGGALSGLFSSLMAQGLISLTNQAPAQDPVGLEFNSDLLKVRYEPAITALYTDLPRQCTTCGLRFKCQEEHSSHMDWHVTKNRISKNRKQKPSRKWFVSVNMWLSGAEALGADAVPGFLPTENVIEKKDDEEMAVPADEDQTVCALCGESFDDFYSDETEEWMYKGAVYMNSPTGSAAGMDRSQLGPIVHAKCRSESNVVSLEDLSKNETGYIEEGSQMKRMRT